jgi:P4 family phage/plasmid primase-like protien
VEPVNQIVPIPTPKQPMSLLDAALLAHHSGLRVVPPKEDGSKAPLAPGGRWKQFQRQQSSEDEIRRWYATSRSGLGIVCGRISGNLEMLEFEGRAVAEGLWQEFLSAAEQIGLRNLVDRIKFGYGERTPSGGFHLLYRCPDGVEGSDHLAERPPTEEEAADDRRRGITKPPPRVLIETRGEGGYVIVAPSGGRVHPSEKPYVLHYGGFDSIIMISGTERDALHALARTFDRMPAAPPRDQGSRANLRTHDENTPGNDFNRRGDWAKDVLEPAGWSFTGTDGEGRQRWYRAPGGRPGWTSATVSPDGEVLIVFSASAGLPTRCGLSKFAAYTNLHHDGDFSTAARALRAQGYGHQSAAVEQSDSAGGDNDGAATEGPPVAADGFPCTDLGNAERLIARHGNELRHVPAWGWVVWDGRRWARDDARAMQLATRTVRHMNRAARRAETVEEKVELAKWAKQSEARARLDAMLHVAAHLEPVASKSDAFDCDPWLLTCWNGTLDLRRGELCRHEPGDYITKLAPIKYDPTARSEAWERFLAEATAGQEGMADFLRRAAGYTLTGDTSEEYVFIAHGGAGRGKTTFLEALAAAMGDYAGSIRVEVLTDSGRSTSGHNEDIARLAGRRLVTAVEVSEGEKLRDGLFKSLTGGDTIPASLKNKPVFDFRPTFKLWMATNQVPRMRADDGGLRRRVIKLPFDNPPAKADKTLKRRLRAEPARQAVLAWAVRGCLEWQQSGLEPPASVTGATSRLWDDMDQVAQFIDDCLVFGDDCRNSSKELQAAYDAWAEELGINPKYRIGFPKVTERLRSKGCKAWKDGHGQRFWLGVRLAKEEGPTAPTAPTAAVSSCAYNKNEFPQQLGNGAVPAVPAVNGSNSYSARGVKPPDSVPSPKTAPRAAARARETDPSAVLPAPPKAGQPPDEDDPIVEWVL